MYIAVNEKAEFEGTIEGQKIGSLEQIITDRIPELEIINAVSDLKAMEVHEASYVSTDENVNVYFVGSTTDTSANIKVQTRENFFRGKLITNVFGAVTRTGFTEVAELRQTVTQFINVSTEPIVINDLIVRIKNTSSVYGLLLSNDVKDSIFVTHGISLERAELLIYSPGNVSDTNLSKQELADQISHILKAIRITDKQYVNLVLQKT